MATEGNTIENRFKQDLVVPCYDTDSSFHLKPASFMDLAQEMAYQAAKELKFGYEDLQVHHTAWVLSRMHFKFNNPPQWRDPVTLYTWHKGVDGLFFLRDFELRAQGDTDFADKSKVLVSCTTSWIVMNMETRRLVRTDEVLNMVPSSTQCSDHAIEQPCGKVLMPKGTEPELVGEHTVTYSDVDIIGHTNNARYMVWAMDCLDYEVSSSKVIREATLAFNRETKPGETVQLYRTSVETESDVIYGVEGKVDGKSCFCINLVYDK